MSDVTVRQLDHTGDLGFELAGPDPESLLARAGRELFGLMFELDTVLACEVRELDVAAPDLPDLLYHWLRAALALFNVDEFVCKGFEVALSGTSLHARAHGEPFDPARHGFITELKAVTLHHLAFEPRDGGWYARVVFDV